MENKNTILLAGGCFWGMEELFRKYPGVLETEVGYTGGDLEDPKYADVKSGQTGHAEALRIVYDDTANLEEILHFFFRIHDPTTVNRQGNDKGTQYRSAVFVRNKDQRNSVVKVIKEVEKLKRFSSPIVTTIEEERIWYPAEEFHQKYLEKSPGGYTCHFLRD